MSPVSQGPTDIEGIISFFKKWKHNRENRKGNHLRTGSLRKSCVRKQQDGKLEDRAKKTAAQGNPSQNQPQLMTPQQIKRVGEGWQLTQGD